MDISTAAILGDIAGHILACFPIYLFGLLVGLLFRSKEPDTRAIYAGVSSAIVFYAIAGFGFASATDGSFNLVAGVFYLPAMFIAFLMLRHHYRKLWQPDDPELERTFE